jgi:Icc-related predicted phosphoesterase
MVVFPRFGLPAIARTGSTFSIRSRMPIERAALARGTDVHPVALDGETASCGTLPPGAYDLLLGSERLERAVWLRAEDPATLPSLRVAHVTDLHLGTSRAITDRFERVVDAVNRLAVDLVLITGDVVQNGDHAHQFDEARRCLARLSAPVFVVPGNHDHGFSVAALLGNGDSRGWRNFSRAFHGLPLLHFTMGNWDFVGFDGGASVLSPMVRTHGIAAEALAAIDTHLDEAHARGRSGVVLFSHTPLRTRVLGSRASNLPGTLGSMRGGRRLEHSMLRAARRGQRVLHLSGHTHWSDVFEVEHHQFRRWDHSRLDDSPRPIEGAAALINTQSATHAGLPGRRNARGHGFATLALGSAAPVLQLHRFD